MPKREPEAERPLTPHQQWMAWEAEVFAPGSEVSPLEVEQATAGNGWPMRSWRVGPEDRIALDAPRWPWSTACLWITARTRERAEEAVAAFRKWGGRERRNPIGRFGQERTFVNAETELRNALAAGTVGASAFHGAQPVTIAAAEWPALEWRRDEHGEALAFDDLLLFGEVRYRVVTLSRAEVMRWWPALDGSAPDGAAQVDPPGPDDGVTGNAENAPAPAEASVDISRMACPASVQREHDDAPIAAAAAAEPVQIVQSRKASLDELHAFLRGIKEQELTRDEVHTLQKQHFGPRARGEREVFGAIAAGHYKHKRGQGKRKGK